MNDLSRRLKDLSPAQREILKAKLAVRKASAPGTEPETAGIYPVTANQRFLWELDRLTDGNPAWNVFTGGHFVGPLRVDILERCFAEIVRRHDVLRTTLVEVDGHLMQQVHPNLKLELPVFDFQHVPAAERADAASNAITADFRRLINLSTGPLVRVSLYRLAPEEHQLLVVMHHTITDWISFNLLNQEVAVLYEAYSAGQPSPLPPLPVQYTGYAVWEAESLARNDTRAHLEYWKKQLQDAPAFMHLPFDYPRPPRLTCWGARHPFTLSADVASALKEFAVRSSVSLFTVTLAAWCVVLSSWSGETDLVVGTPVMGRQASKVDRLIGLFLNHLPLRARLRQNCTFSSLLEQVKQTVLEGFAHQQVPFGAMVEALAPQRSPSYMPLFQVMFFFLTQGALRNFGGLELKPFEAYAGISRYDVSLAIWDRPTGMAGFFEYSTSLFREDSIRALAAHFLAILKPLCEHPDLPLSRFAAVEQAPLAGGTP